MINLKLAEYTKEGEFKSFLELGRNFLLGGEKIVFINNPDHYVVDFSVTVFGLDKKDPLNRFDGLFDGRTYGGGRFVLIESFRNKRITYSEDDVFCFDEEDKILGFLSKNLVVTDCRYGTYGFTFSREALLKGTENFLENDHFYTGNLHQNPELWSKIK